MPTKIRVRRYMDMKQIIAIKRAYEPEDKDDGYRIYVDRLWPRGMSHETFHYDLWDKEIAPSAELRRWFHENPEEEWSEFERRYISELKANPALPALRNAISGKPKVTLLYSSHDTTHNNALVLKEILEHEVV